MTVMLGEHPPGRGSAGFDRLPSPDDLFRAAVDRSPDRLALVDPDAVSLTARSGV